MNSLIGESTRLRRITTTQGDDNYRRSHGQGRRKPILSCALSVIMALTVLNISSRTNAQPLVQAVAAVGMTVSDMERAVAFYENVLSFKKISDVEVYGNEYEHLMGMFGLRMRVVRIQLGGEVVELTEYLTPKGRPIPGDSRSNDRWFQHVAIIVSDMDRAY